MFASLASQSATSGGLTAGVVAFGIAAATLVLTLTGAAVALANVSTLRVSELRTAGPEVKRLGGGLLIVIGLWFFYLSIANPTYLLP